MPGEVRATRKLSCPGLTGHPVRRGLSVQAVLPLEYWIARSIAQVRISRAMTRGCGYPFRANSVGVRPVTCRKAAENAGTLA